MTDNEYDDLLENFERKKKQQQKENLKSFRKHLDGKAGQMFDDYMKDSVNQNRQEKAKETQEQKQPEEKEVEISVLSRVLLMDGPFEKSAKYLNDEEIKDTIRIPLNDEKYCLYRMKGRNDKGEGIYEYVRTNYV